MATTEFTSRLRIAIKTKIQELGIEADDELPDYIMIMIANKKDKTKMKNDLLLFLNENTDVFVDWLFEFFDKINKKDSGDHKKEIEKPIKKEIRKHDEEKPRSRSRSPVRRSRSRSPKRSSRHDDDRSNRRQPIRAPSPSHKLSRRRSRSVEKDRRSRRDDRRKITYSDSDDDGRRVRSAVVSNRNERHTPPKVSSQVVVKKRKADHDGDSKVGSSLFKKALNDSVLRDDQPRRKMARHIDDVLQVNTNKQSRRTILVEDISDISEEEEPETQFIVKMNKAAALRKTLKASKLANLENDDDQSVLKRKRKTDQIRAFLKLSGVKTKSNVKNGKVDKLTRKKILMAVAGKSADWDGKISFDDDEELSQESDNDEAEIDAFLADSMIPPTVSLSRPVMPVPQKKQFGAVQPKAPEVGKIPERCKFYPHCRDETTCMYSHPAKPCINFPNCWFGDKCLFIHPKCRFEPNCTKPGCPYMHTMPRQVIPKPIVSKPPNVLPIKSPEKEETTNATTTETSKEKSEEAKEQEVGGEVSDDKGEKENEKAPSENENGEKTEISNDETKTEEKKDDKDTGADIPLQEGPLSAASLAPKIKPINTTNANIPCRFGGRCHSEACTFRHPKKCRYDETCTNEGCYFWHPKKNAGRFRWTKT